MSGTAVRDGAPSPWLRTGWPLLALLLVTLLAYARLWFVEFSWDDEALIVDNQVTSSLANIGEFFTRDLWSTTRLPWLKSGYYRPLMLISLAFDRSVFGLSSAEAHVHSALWHLAAVAALAALLRKLVDAGPALAGAALFALHPVQSEVVALVAARNDSMAAALGLAALWLLADRKVGTSRLVLAGLALLAGLLSKESAVLAPFMLLALDLARWRRPGSGWRYLSLTVALVAWWGLRSAADLGEALVPDAGNFALVGKSALGIAAVYGKLLIWPWPLTPARHVFYLPPVHQTLLGLVVLAALLGTAVVKGRHRGLVIVGLVWAVLAFLPTLAATLDKGLLGERYLYLPLAGLALVLASAVDRVPRWLIPAFAVASVATLQLRLPDWQNSRTVWQKAHDMAPTPFTAGGLAWYLHRDGDLDAALPLFVMALEGDPPYRDVCDMVVSSFLEAKQARRGVEVGRWALREGRCAPDSLITNHLAVALAGVGEWAEAAQVAASQPGGVQGPGLVVIAADRARQGDLRTALQLAARMPQDTTFIDRTAKLLRLGGQPEASARLLAAREGANAPARPPAELPGETDGTGQ